MPVLAYDVYTDDPGAGPYVVFPTHAHQILSNCIHIVGVSILSYCFARRTEADRFGSRLWWASLTWARLLIILVFLDSWVFLAFSGILVNGVGLSFSLPVCSLGIFACIFFYSGSKALIYLFLVERVWIVCSAGKTLTRAQSRIYRGCAVIFVGYAGIIVVMILGRFAQIREDGVCVIGLGTYATVPLLTYDLFTNVVLTSVFLWALYREQSISVRLRHLARRTALASGVALTTSCVNILVLALLHGKQLGWVCLGACATDVTVNALVIFWVTAPAQREPNWNYGGLSPWEAKDAYDGPLALPPLNFPVSFVADPEHGVGRDRERERERERDIEATVGVSLRAARTTSLSVRLVDLVGTLGAGSQGEVVSSGRHVAKLDVDRNRDLGADVDVDLDVDSDRDLGAGKNGKADLAVDVEDGSDTEREDEDEGEEWDITESSTLGKHKSASPRELADLYLRLDGKRVGDVKEDGDRDVRTSWLESGLDDVQQNQQRQDKYHQQQRQHPLTLSPTQFTELDLELESPATQETSGSGSGEGSRACLVASASSSTSSASTAALVSHPHPYPHSHPHTTSHHNANPHSHSHSHPNSRRLRRLTRPRIPGRSSSSPPTSPLHAQFIQSTPHISHAVAHSHSHPSTPPPPHPHPYTTSHTHTHTHTQARAHASSVSISGSSISRAPVVAHHSALRTGPHLAHFDYDLDRGEGPSSGPGLASRGPPGPDGTHGTGSGSVAGGAMVVSRPGARRSNTFPARVSADVDFEGAGSGSVIGSGSGSKDANVSGAGRYGHGTRGPGPSSSGGLWRTFGAALGLARARSAHVNASAGVTDESLSGSRNHLQDGRHHGHGSTRKEREMKNERGVKRSSSQLLLPERQDEGRVQAKPHSQSLSSSSKSPLPIPPFSRLSRALDGDVSTADGIDGIDSGDDYDEAEVRTGKSDSRPIGSMRLPRSRTPPQVETHMPTSTPPVGWMHDDGRSDAGGGSMDGTRMRSPSLPS